RNRRHHSDRRNSTTHRPHPRDIDTTKDRGRHLAERSSHRCQMKSFVLGCLLVAFVLPQLATGAREQTRNMPDIISGPPLADLPNFPIGYDVIQGNPPDTHIHRWIRYVIIGQQNHPFPIVFFSPQEFKPKTALEMLIVLSDSEYKSL